MNLGFVSLDEIIGVFVGEVLGFTGLSRQKRRSPSSRLEYLSGLDAMHQNFNYSSASRVILVTDEPYIRHLFFKLSNASLWFIMRQKEVRYCTAVDARYRMTRF